jgi:GMP synthase-like glutamine amidotransferase
MKICLLENDTVDSDMSSRYAGYGAMFQKLFQSIGCDWEFTYFKTFSNHFPTHYDTFDAVLLTGSRADSFSDETWVVTLREHVSSLIAIKKPLLGICFGHQLIAKCMGAQVARAPQGWGMGCMHYDWHHQHAPYLTDRPDHVALLASHQDQVFALPPGAKLLASSMFCPIAAYTVDNHIFCVQAHPEFDTQYCTYLLDKRRSQMPEADYTTAKTSLRNSHDGAFIARAMAAFLHYRI